VGAGAVTVRLRMLRGSTELYRTLSFFISHAMHIVKPCFPFWQIPLRKIAGKVLFCLTESPGALIIIE